MKIAGCETIAELGMLGQIKTEKVKGAAAEYLRRDT